MKPTIPAFGIPGRGKRACILSLLCAAAAVALSGQTYNVLHNFSCTGTGGAYPDAALVQDTDGNLYGTTYLGGNVSGGTIFKITPGGAFTMLYDFCTPAGLCPQDIGPYAPLVEATNGRLYGTTLGVAEQAAFPGAIFEITGGTLQALYSFCAESGCADGYNPSGLMQAANGDLYGTTQNGGSCDGGEGVGTIFKITPGGTFTTLYSACPPAGQGGRLIQAADGNFYGLMGGGLHRGGAVFKYTPSGTLTKLYTFCTQPGCPDGEGPLGLVQEADGDLYGTTELGGADCPLNLLGCGTIFKLTLSGVLTTLHTFCQSGGGCQDGANPIGGLVLGSDGKLYGSTGAGGPQGQGTIFAIAPDGALTTVYDALATALVQDTNGDFYGTGGPALSCGTIFRLSVGLGPFVKTLPTSGKITTSVKILGTDLTGAASVTFNGTPAAFTVNSTGSAISTAVPSGATTGKVQVVTASGTLASNLPFRVP
jgi:uncharacterized repeat protein (TIGR03803 family)